MTEITFISWVAKQGLRLSSFLFLCVVLGVGCTTGNRTAKLEVVPKWTRVEQTFESSLDYPYPLQSCTLTVVFTSPRGETNRVYGFWDGGKTWRVRFSPNQPGRWTYQTFCSDPANRGLQNQTGAFLCTAPLAIGRFHLHGPVKVARDGRHFEHQDGTPFFWLADSAWDAARLSSPKEWTLYAQVRAYQAFSAAQWSVGPGKDSTEEVAFTGRTQILPNPKFLQRLDAKVETLNRAGLLSIIAPLWNVDRQNLQSLPPDQLILWMRYLMARWDANYVAWLLDVQGTEADVALWKRIGQAVFAEAHRTPVILFVGESPSALEPFRQEPWPDAFAAPATNAAQNQATLDRPLIDIGSPLENSVPAGSDQRIPASEIRRTLWSSVLAAPAGISYGTEAVARWNPAEDGSGGTDLPLWRKSLYLPGAKEAALLSAFFNSFAFWRLHPAPDLLAKPPEGSAQPPIAAAQSDGKELTVIYVPEGPALELSLKALPRLPILNWINPRTGQSSTAVAVVGPRSIKLPPPEAGDWVLVAKAGK